MFKRFLVLLFALAIGCSGNNCDLSGDTTASSPIVSYKDRIISIWVDNGFSKEELVEINNSILEWNVTFNGARVLSVVDWKYNYSDNNFSIIKKNQDLLITRIESTDPKFAGQYPTGLLGFVNEDNGTPTVYIVSDIIDNDLMFGVMLHELGHVFGAGHSESGLMSVFYSKEATRCVDFWTALQVQRAMNIEPGIMQPCF